MGWLKGATGGYAAGFGVLAFGLTATAALILLVGRALTAPAMIPKTHSA